MAGFGDPALQNGRQDGEGWRGSVTPPYPPSPGLRRTFGRTAREAGRTGRRFVKSEGRLPLGGRVMYRGDQEEARG